MASSAEIDKAKRVLKNLKNRVANTASTQAWYDAVVTLALSGGYAAIAFDLNPWDGGFSGHVEGYYFGKEPNSGFCSHFLWDLLRGDYNDHTTPRMGCGNGRGKSLTNAGVHQAQVSSKWPLPECISGTTTIERRVLTDDQRKKIKPVFICIESAPCHLCEAPVLITVHHKGYGWTPPGVVCDSCTLGDN